MKWLNDVQPDTLGVEAKAAYETYKAAYRAAKVQREAFEALARDVLAAEHGVDGDTVAFGYRFGKLSIGIGEARERKVAKPAPLSLKAWLDANA